jgi:hypothetical protein
VGTGKGDIFEGSWKIHGAHQGFHPGQGGAMCGTCTGIQGCEAEVEYALGLRGCHGVNAEACVVAQGV